MIGTILTKEYLMSLYPQFKVEPVQLCCYHEDGYSETAGFNQDWLDLFDSLGYQIIGGIWQQPTPSGVFYVGRLYPAKIDFIQFHYDGNEYTSGTSTDKIMIDIKFNGVTASSEKQYFQFHGWKIVPM